MTYKAADDLASIQKTVVIRPPCYQKLREVRVKVDPRNTSQLCSGCGAMVRKDLTVRVHRCPNCGFTADRDYNASLNIRNRGLAGNPSSALKRRITEPIAPA